MSYPNPLTSKRQVMSALGTHGIFWFWNLLFLSLVSFGMTPMIFYDLVRDAMDGFVPLNFALTCLMLLAVPYAATIVGLLKFRTDHRKLLALFYGVEGPIFLMLLIRLFVVRELNAGSAFMLGTFLLGAVAFAYSLFKPLSQHGPKGQHLSFAASSLTLFVGLFSAVLVLFFAIPAAWAFLGAFFKFGWLTGLLSAPWRGSFALLFGLTFFALSATLFIAMPVVLTVLYPSRWYESFQQFRASHGRAPAIAITASVCALLTAGFFVSDRQPDPTLLQTLSEKPKTPEERRERLARSEEIRADLIDIYLSPYRYVTPEGRAKMIKEIYEDTLPMTSGAAQRVQSWFNAMVGPFLYKGPGDAKERQKARDLYTEFFDESIQRGAKNEILTALSSTYERDQREAGLIDEGARKVHLLRQSVKVTPVGQSAQVELYEVYENQTANQQEVLYYFTLPDSAAITGLWLGNSDQRSKAFSYRVSPRGAAQQVYRNEVTRRVDPALLEQVGPRQYRLRAFPVPRKRSRRQRERGQLPQQLHLWMQLQVLPKDGAWPLPKLAEARNVYWDKKTERILNKERVSSHEAWLPESVSFDVAGAPASPSPKLLQIDPNLAISARPIEASEEAQIPSGARRYAVLIDTSRSMAAQAKRLNEALSWLKQKVAPKASLHFMIGASASSGAQPSWSEEAPDQDALIFYGRQSVSELLSQFEALRSREALDAVIVLTDRGAFELEKDNQTPYTASAPLWLVHLGGRISAGYDDHTLEHIQRSKGGVVDAVQKPFAAMSAAQKHGQELIGMSDGYLWSVVEKTGPVQSSSPNEPVDLLAIAARQYVRRATQLDDTARLPVLDQLHRVAKRYSVVTPYSSMIVLVNERQHKALDRAEAAKDRFDREVESQEERLPTPPTGSFGGDITGTPEPETWALLALVLGGFAYIRKRRDLGLNL